MCTDTRRRSICRCRVEFEILGENAREHTPNSVCVQFERTANLLDQSACHLDDRRASQAGDPRHLHGMPPCTFAHDVAVERVENALVRELERIVDHDELLRLVDLRNGATLARILSRFFFHVLCSPCTRIGDLGISAPCRRRTGFPSDIRSPHVSRPWCPSSSCILSASNPRVACAATLSALPRRDQESGAEDLQDVSGNVS
jgi:hypothetical protein